MKKLLLLFCALLCLGGSRVWADGLKVSTKESASAEYQYKIFCRNASTYYLGNTTNATNSGADYGLFAFFADNSGDYTNGYYIYSIFEGKWVTYTAAASYSEGKNKISLEADKPSVPWNIAADNTDSKYYDIRPFKTDKSVANMSWNWHGGTTANTSNTMGFKDYTDSSSGWGFVLAGGSGSPVADRKVVALYNVPSDNNEYPLYNSSGTAKVYSATTGQNPQYLILRQNGLDDSGEALYRLQKAEADGKYLNYQSFGTSVMNYLFLNTSSSFFSYYTYSSTATSAESPYYDFFRKWPNATDNSSRPYSNQVAQCNDGAVNMYSSTYDALPVPRGAKGSWNGRWKVAELAGYTVWQVVMLGATSGTVTYSGSSLISGGTATQSNNGMFVLSATPSASDFTASVVDGYLTDPSVTIDSDRKLIKVAYTEYASIRSTIVNFLANTPETIGYPTSAARATLQAAIDAFDASSKVTSDLVTLNTAYTTFQSTTDVNLPELGKIYTIQNYIKSPSKTTYLKNEDGTLTIGADASATSLNNLWIVRKSGNTYVLQSAADLTKYIVYTSFTLAASGSPWTFSKGTEWPYISMYNSSLGGGRYVACNGSDQFGTAGNGNYYASAITQYSGWSTDFKFVESDEYKIITYKLMWNGSQIATQERLVEIGSSPSSPWDVPAYCDDYTYNVAEIAANTNEVEVTLNWDGPFEFSTDYANAKWYYLKLNNKYVYYDTEGSDHYLLFSNDRVEDPKALWAFFGNPYDGVKVANSYTGEGYFIENNTPATMKTSGFISNQIGSNSWGFYLYDSDWYIYDDGSKGFVGSAQAAAYVATSNVTLKVEPYIVTYNLKFGGSTIATKTMDKVTGDSEDLFPSEWERDFCTYSYEPAEIGNSTTSVDVTMTWDGPFDISADYENAVWYYLAVNGKWGKNSSSGYLNAPDIFSDIADVRGADDGQWAFFGNPYDGFLLSLKEKYMSTIQVYLSSQLAAPAFGDATGSTEKWTVTRLSGSTFTLNCGDKYIVDNSTTMGFKTTALEGSEGTFSVRSYYCQQLIDDLYAWADDNHRNELFGPSETWLSTNASQVISMFPNMSKSTYDGITVPDDLTPVVPNYPSTGYYRIKSSGQRSIGESYIGYGSSDYGTGLRTVAAANKLSDASTVIKFTGNAGTYKLSTEGLNVQSQTGANAAFPATDAAGVDFVFSVSTPGVVTIRNAASASGECQGDLHEGQDGSEVKGVINWKANAAESKWTVEAAENITVSLTAIGDYTYATLGLPFGVTLPADVKAYILTVSGEWAIPTEISEVPAGTGVLLRGTSSSVTSATLTINDAASATTDGNKLVPTYVDITGARSDGEYILGNDATDGLGFYQRKSGKKIGANKAYLKLDADLAASVKGLLLRFDDETGISTVQGSGLMVNGSEIFNLAGQRMSRVQKGVNIVNGKKVLVK